MRRGIYTYLMLGLMVIALIAAPLAALADTINNNINNAAAGTITAGGSMVARYWISAQPASQDGEAGCNATVASPLTLTINVPTGAVAAPSVLTFTGCGNNAGDPNAQSVTFSSNTPSAYAVTHTWSDGGVGSYNNGANFTLTVNAGGDTNAPTVSLGVPDPTGSNGWNTTAPVVLTITASDTNPVDTLTCNINGSSASVDGITGLGTNSVNASLSVSAEGISTVSCFATDRSGNSSTAAEAEIKIDTVAPSISAFSRTAANGNGWNNGDVTVTWSCADSVSGVVAASVSQTVSTEGNSQSATGTCADNAGNTASDTQTGINIDKTAPTASASASPAANGYGWNNTDVTVSFSGTDTLSGIDSCSAAAVVSTEGANQSTSGTCTDKAGNVSALAVAAGINIDKTAPTVSLVGGPANNGTYYFGSVPAAPTCNASDSLSGLDGTCSVSGYSSAVGSHTVTAGATDKAGNSNSASATYTVNAWTINGFYQPVDMGGVVNTVKNGSTVPLKFEIFAGPTELKATSNVQQYAATLVGCITGLPEDEIELTATGATSLRYDTVSDQFIFNWQTPKKAGTCYKATFAFLDGSSLEALFRLK